MNIIYFPHKLGQLKNGLQNSLNILKSIINKPINVVKCDNSIKDSNLYKNLDNLYKINKLHKKKINIGGDHSMAIPTVAESLNKHHNLKVLWFDAHPDINTYQQSKSKNIHGMPLAYLTGIDKDYRFEYIKNNLKFENLLYIGIRDIDKFENDIILKNNIKYITADNFNQKPQKSLKKILDFCKNDPIHLSFDVDCIDPLYMPCTGTPVKNGLNLEATKLILNNICYKNIINIDITELNFKIGTQIQQKTTIKNFLYLFNDYLNR